jgi:hypothetical protein
VVLPEGMLFVESANVADDWLWHNGRIVIDQSLGLTIWVSLWWKKQRVVWRVLIVRR